MGKLRGEELSDSERPAMSRWLALEKIRKSVGKRRKLIHGHLHDTTEGAHCAIGTFFEDHPDAVLEDDLIEEIAAVNDSVPPTMTPRERWRVVYAWLKWKTEEG